VLAQPKRTAVVPKAGAQRVLKTLRPSDVRLKVRNIDEKQVTNDDLKKLFAKIGELRVCRFDRNEFGNFLGQATVTYVKPEDAKTAIQEYHGAFLDDKVLTVEYDIVPQVSPRVPKTLNAQAGPLSGPKSQIKLTKGPGSQNKGKTLRI